MRSPSARCYAPLVVLALVLAACQRAGPGPADARGLSAERIQAYQCGDMRVETRLDGGNLVLVLPDRVLTLPPAVAASGARFDDLRGNEFWTRGSRSALIALGGGPRTECHPTAARSPWAAARDRGVLFRAVGQEPGWVAEVDAGERPAVRVSLDHGRRRLDVSQAHRVDEPWTRTTGYRGEVDGTPLELRIRTETCRDSMSGEEFESRVVLVVGGKTYRGCGRFLGGRGDLGDTA